MRSWAISKSAEAICLEPNGRSCSMISRAPILKERLRGWSAPRAVTPVITVRTLCKSSSPWSSTPEGFPVAYEVFDGDTADVTTLEEIVDKIENKYGIREAGGGCLIVALSARIISRIFGNAEPIIWWALRAASSPTLNASCLRATGKKFAGKPGGRVSTS